MAGTAGPRTLARNLAAARLKALTSLARTVDNALTALGKLRERAEQRRAGGGRAARAAPAGVTARGGRCTGGPARFSSSRRSGPRRGTTSEGLTGRAGTHGGGSPHREMIKEMPGPKDRP